MEAIGLEALVRRETGKGVARKLRRSGYVPAVMYGVGEPQPLSLPSREISRLLATEGGHNAVIDLNITGEGQKPIKKGVIVRDYQVSPVTGVLLHCDLYELQKGHRVNVTVPIHVVGDTPVGVREQGILQHQMHEVEIDCLPDAIPDALEVDASALQIGDSIHISDLELPEGVRIHAAEESTIVSVLPPKIQAEEVEAEEEAGEEEAEEEGGES